MGDCNEGMVAVISYSIALELEMMVRIFVESCDGSRSLDVEQSRYRARSKKADRRQRNNMNSMWDSQSCHRIALILFLVGHCSPNSFGAILITCG